MLYGLIAGKICAQYLEVVDFNIAFCLDYLKSLLLMICIKQTPSFETHVTLNSLSIFNIGTAYLMGNGMNFLGMGWGWVAANGDGMGMGSKLTGWGGDREIFVGMGLISTLYFLLVCYSNCVHKRRRFSDIRLQKCRDIDIDYSYSVLLHYLAEHE